MQIRHDTVTISSFHDDFSAHVCSNSLIEHGIPATVVGEFTSDFRVGSPGRVDVLVDSQSAVLAQKLLADVIADRKPSERESDTLEDEAVFSKKRRMVWTILSLNAVGVLCYVVYALFSS